MFNRSKKYINIDEKIPVIPKENVTNLDSCDNLWGQYYKTMEKKSEKLNSIKEVTLLFIADLHNDNLSEEFLRNIADSSNKVDGCVILGDVSERNLQIVLDVLNTGTAVYGVLGNHDKVDLYDGTRVTSIGKRAVRIKNVTIAGIDGSIKYNDKCENVFSHNESIIEARRTPPADILVSHDIPYCPDWPGSTSHKGMIGLTQYMYSYGVLFNVHGHLHNSKWDILPKGNICIGVYQSAIIHFKRNKYDIAFIENT